MLPTSSLRQRPTAGWALVLPLAVLLCACATPPTSLPDPPPSRDDLFGPSSEDTNPDRVLALSDEMRAYADGELRARMSRRDARLALVEALNKRSQIKIDYDATRTGNAAETFAARNGNCMALMLMTSAFARHLGLEFTFRNVLLPPEYSRADGLTMQNGHVNLLIGQTTLRSLWSANDVVVDFLPLPEGTTQRVEVIDVNTVLAMYMNNRAAERLAEGRLDDAYAWSRAARRQAPAYSPAINTLGVIYLRRGALAEAEQALRYVLAREPENTAALTNLVSLLRTQGRGQDAEPLAATLHRLQPLPPFELFEQGRQALAAGNAARARELFDKELRLQPFQHEVHFWAAQAALLLGDERQATEHLRQAMDYSPTLAGQKLYAAKLDRLRALRVQ